MRRLTVTPKWLERTITRLREWLPRTEFGRGVVTLASGTIIAQAIPIAISPILTRLFDPAELGALAFYLSVVAIAAVLATGRYELAIPLARRNAEAFELLRVAIGLSIVVSTLCGVLLYSFAGDLARLSSIESWGNSLLAWVPIGVLLTTIGMALSYWCNRSGLYKRMATARVAQAAVTAGVQISAGIAGVGSAALLAASAIGQATLVTLLGRVTWQRDRARIFRRRPYGWLAAVRRHRDFPKFMIPGQLANVASAQAPILLLAIFFGPAMAGYYALAERVLLLPTSIIGSAVGDVYRQHAAAAFHATGNCRDLYLRTARRLAILAMAPLVIMVTLGPPVFALVFGQYWRPAGEVAAVLAPMAFFQIISSPLSQTVLLARMHRLDMLWQFVRLLFAVGAFVVAYVLGKDHLVAVGLYAAFFSVLYLLHSLMQYRAASGIRPVPSDGTAERESTK
jgi:O-antigen/teichoic acid export membrane protein